MRFFKIDEARVLYAQVAAFLGAVADGPRGCEFDDARGRSRSYASGSTAIRSALVLAPTTMMQHWVRELRRWAPRVKVVALHRCCFAFDRAAKQGPVALAEFLATALAAPSEDAEDADAYRFVCCVCSYDGLHRLSDVLLAKRWGYVVLDEGQRIRNPETRVTMLCKKLRTARRLLLSGTPVQNSLKELWSLFDFTNPGRLGTFKAFDDELAQPIRAGEEASSVVFVTILFTIRPVEL